MTNKLLDKLLALCRKHRYTRVEIYPTKINVDWKGKDSDSDGPRINGSPALWEIVEDLDISWGCGGTDYHQFKSDNLPVGIWHRKSGDRNWQEGTRDEVYEMLKREDEKWAQWRREMFG